LHNFYHVLSPGILDTLAQFKKDNGLRVVMTAHDFHLACPNSGGSWFRWWTRRREAIEPGESLALFTRRWDERSLAHSVLKVVQYGWSYRWRRRQEVIDLVMCPSRCVQAMLAPLGLATIVLPHPIPPLPGVAGERGKKLSLVFAGRIEPEKGLKEFLQQLPGDFDAELTVIGAGSELAQCEAISKARGFGARVKFMGRLPHDETLKRIAGCHVLVQPSRVLETYGLTLIEALAQGTNVLAINRGAAREMVEDSGVGFLFEPDDKDDLATQLRRIQRAFDAGMLNRFDIHAFLAARREDRYLGQLLLAYGDNQSPVPSRQRPHAA
jgi:glycosyltransferase involved in cell wall biosynthesis